MIKLPDFGQSIQYKRLRMDMKADEDAGYQILNDIERLTYSESEQLFADGLSVDASLVSINKDQVLVYKNTPVWLFCLSDDANYHLGHCSTVRSWRIKRRTVVIAEHTSIDPGMSICRECLSVIGYQGISERELKRRDYIDRLVKDFVLVK